MNGKFHFLHRIFGASFLALTLTTAVAAEQYCEPWQPPAPPAPVAAAPDPSPAAPATKPAPRWVPTAFKPRAFEGIGPPLIFLGDSLTESITASAPELQYPALTAGPRAFTVYAAGGQSSTVLASLFKQVELPADAVVVIWIGRNNFRDSAAVLADVAETVRQIGDRRFLVLSIIQGRYYSELPGKEGAQAVIELNTLLGQAYPDNFVTVGDDLLCSDRVDAIHLTDAGQLKIARAVQAALVARGW